MSIKDSFIKFADKHNLPFKEETGPNGENIFNFALKGSNGNYGSRAVALENENIFVYFVDYGIKIPKDKIKEAALYILEINYNLKLSAFQLDVNEGSIIVRTCQFIYGSEQERQNLIESIIFVTGTVADKYYNDIYKNFK